MTPELTVVVPTRNRRHSVLRLLCALGAQTAASRFDAVVVADGCTDGTAATLRAAAWPFALEVVERDAGGPAAARNDGAARARGNVLLFLDDDVEPYAGVVAAHLLAHADAEGGIALGRLPPVVTGSSMFARILRGWWVAMQEPLRRPGHRFSYKDLLSGHFSIRRADFEALGGFDTALRVHEDYDLGYRAIAAGLRLRLADGAVARHHDDSTLEKALQRKFDEGAVDVALALRYPALAPGLPFAWRGDASRRKLALRRLAWVRPPAGDALIGSLRQLLPVYEAANLQFRWRALLGGLLDYWYWRGVASAAGSPERLRAIIAAAPEPPEPLPIDLAAGVEAAEAALDRHRPASARLTWGADLVAVVPAYPGHEPLRGAHLRPLLARWCARDYVRARARHGRLPPWVSDTVGAHRDVPSTP